MSEFTKGMLVRYVGTHRHVGTASGWVGRLLTMQPCPLTGQPAWFVDPPLFPEHRREDAFLARTDWIVQRVLRPIQNPGEDVKDAHDVTIYDRPPKAKVTA